jgi:hypothetical protein
MQKYEYKIHAGHDGDVMTAAINDYAKEGWEVDSLSVGATIVIVMKREVKRHTKRTRIPGIRIRE